ncbi:MAG TPA: hypothetical protein PK639_03975 [Candidatus Woesebacteria bacterium]|nr:hypothetical protein [Candidatus Woesebacteria bacterium]
MINKNEIKPIISNNALGIEMAYGTVGMTYLGVVPIMDNTELVGYSVELYPIVDGKPNFQKEIDHVVFMAREDDLEEIAGQFLGRLRMVENPKDIFSDVKEGNRENWKDYFEKENL